MMAMEARGRRPDPSRDRYPNGKLKQPSASQREAKRREKIRAEQEAVKSVVLMQPHRVWWSDPNDMMLSSALGRFCIQHRLKKAIYEAGLEYSSLLRRLWAAKGVPTDISLSSGVGSGLGPSEATVRRWEREIEGIENELRRAAPRSLAYIAVRHLAIDEQDIPLGLEGRAITGLLALARALDKDVGRHPFL